MTSVRCCWHIYHLKFTGILLWPGKGTAWSRPPPGAPAPRPAASAFPCASPTTMESVRWGRTVACVFCGRVTKACWGTWRLKLFDPKAFFSKGPSDSGWWQQSVFGLSDAQRKDVSTQVPIQSGRESDSLRLHQHQEVSTNLLWRLHRPALLCAQQVQHDQGGLQLQEGLQHTMEDAVDYFLCVPEEVLQPRRHVLWLAVTLRGKHQQEKEVCSGKAQPWNILWALNPTVKDKHLTWPERIRILMNHK